MKNSLVCVGGSSRLWVTSRSDGPTTPLVTQKSTILDPTNYLTIGRTSSDGDYFVTVSIKLNRTHGEQ